ncbi:hypothetical protein AVEN_150701-1 [Araneus ventricosus]|uniref:Uncharacterized protein n=1 Tax=Araneus ventricosus TaxID=182803 RepID=A0A4Y2LSV5_ARAVE|nr:hypothetical protein AVEN_150701-1 [Araneus ventricosus]
MKKLFGSEYVSRSAVSRWCSGFYLNDSHFPARGIPAHMSMNKITAPIKRCTVRLLTKRPVKFSASLLVLSRALKFLLLWKEIEIPLKRMLSFSDILHYSFIAAHIVPLR